MTKEQKRHPVREAGAFPEKVKAFWEYYKVQTIIACVLVLFVGYGVYDVLSAPKQPQADFYVIAMTGEELTDTQKQEMEAGIKQAFPVMNGENPTVEILYHVYAPDEPIQEESGGTEGYASTLQNAANTTVQLEQAQKQNALYLFDGDYLAYFQDEDSFADLSSKYSDNPGVQGKAFFLKESGLFSQSSVPEDLQLWVKEESLLDTSAENYDRQMEAVKNLISGTAARTQEQVKEADEKYEQAQKDYSES